MSKTIAKIDFIKFLKTITSELDKEEIKYDIPFCHINKPDFNHIYIIIPDHIPVFDINRIFNCTTIKEDAGIITSMINDFNVIFIKSSEQDWNLNFYYYSWNVLHILIDMIFYNSFNVRYNRIGLIYEYKDKKINISKNLSDIFEFINLPLHMVINGFPTEYIIFNYIYSSDYFDSQYFTINNFKKFDPNFELNESYYKEFIKYMPEIKYDKKPIDEQIVLLDAWFQKSKLLEKISRIQLKEDFPNFKESDFNINPKSLDTLKKEKEEQIRKRKINLKKSIKRKDDDFNVNFE
ncbi:hypothetical protein M0Q97_05530 [Candidatus Dojkabacteria bacterium]|jgi:hypothetical protein|nr:hypothetical protein [Candidatus Dojkabacteria bacterium]